MAPAAECGDWSPNWATHPGEHLAEFIDVHGCTQADFARLTGHAAEVGQLTHLRR